MGNILPTPDSIAYISTDLEPLIGKYIANRRNDIAAARTLLSSQDPTLNMEMLRTMGHTMKGSGASYGFLYISECGRIIEQAAKEHDAATITEAINTLEKYLNTVRIVFVEDEE